MDKLEILKKIGFKEYEAKIYLTLSKLGTATVSQISNYSDVPKNKIYESLESLEKKNKVIIIAKFPKQYKIINEDLLEKEANDILNFTQELIKNIKTPKLESSNDFFTILKGRDAVQKKLRDSDKEVKIEILSSNKLSNLLYNNIKSLKDCTQRGVKVRFITTFRKDRIPIYLKYLETGMELRVFDEEKHGYLLPRISIHDKKIARLTIGEPEILKSNEYITIWTQSPIFATAFYSYLDDLWKKCESIENYLEKK